MGRIDSRGTFLKIILFHKHKIDGQDEAAERHKMVPVQGLAAEEDGGEHGEDRQGNNLLDDFQLHQRVRAAIADEAYAVGRHLAAILKEGDAPREGDDRKQGPV